MADKETQQSTAAHLMAPNQEAQHAADEEKSMGLFQAIKLYPKAVGWSVVLSSALIMEGYDLALLGSLYGSPMFNQKYGVFNEKTGKWAVQPSWQSALLVSLPREVVNKIDRASQIQWRTCGRSHRPAHQRLR